MRIRVLWGWPVNGPQRRPGSLGPEAMGIPGATPMIQSCFLRGKPHLKAGLEGPRAGIDTSFTKEPMWLVRGLPRPPPHPHPHRQVGTWASLKRKHFCSSKVFVTKQNSLEKDMLTVQ